MKPVTQTRIGKAGNCLSACLASIMDLDHIPDWLDLSCGIDPNWFNNLNVQLYNFKRFRYNQVTFYETYKVPSSICIAHYRHKQDYNRLHAVIYDRYRDQINHDPHPDKIVINDLDNWTPAYLGYLYRSPKGESNHVH